MPATKTPRPEGRAHRPQADHRNRERTEAALVAAVGDVIDAHGVLGIGVNAVAKAAGVDKVLIYRYFGGLDGLVEAFARSGDFWPTADELLGDRDALLAMPFGPRAELVFRRYVDALRRRPRTLAILAGEVIARSPLHAPLESVREETGLALIAVAGADAPPGFDLAAFATMVSSALHYLLVRSRFVSQFNGLRLDEDEGWDRLLAFVRHLAS